MKEQVMVRSLAFLVRTASYIRYPTLTWDTIENFNILFFHKNEERYERVCSG